MAWHTLIAAHIADTSAINFYSILKLITENICATENYLLNPTSNSFIVNCNDGSELWTLSFTFPKHWRLQYAPVHRIWGSPWFTSRKLSPPVRCIVSHAGRPVNVYMCYSIRFLKLHSFKGNSPGYSVAKSSWYFGVNSHVCLFWKTYSFAACITLWYIVQGWGCSPFYAFSNIW